jgi:DNA replication protein DnaC
MSSTAENALSALDAFASMIDAAPDEDATNGAQDTNAPDHSVGLSTKDGWGEKYTRRIDLTGEKWFAAFEQAKETVKAGGILLLLGNRGPGKTQMAAEVGRCGLWPRDVAVWNGLRNVYDKTALYRRAMDVFLDLRDAAQNNSGTSEKKVLERLESVGLLVIDEFQERGGSEWENRVICNLMDKRYSAQRPTILIANYTREEMAAALSPSVKDRIRENGKAIIFDWPSYRAKPA